MRLDLVPVCFSVVRTMPVSCCAVDCTNRFTKGSGVGFFVFPVDPERKKKWIHAISRDKWEPKSHDRLCGEHFVNGRPSKEPTNVDYVPTIFKDRKRRPSAPTDDSDRSRRLVKRMKTCKEAEEVRDCAQALLDLSASDSTALVKEEEVGSILNDSVMEDNVLLAKQVHALQQQVLESSTVSHPSPSMLNLIETKDSKTRFYTGLPNYEVFQALITYFEPKVIRARSWQGRRTRDDDNDMETGRRSKLSVAEELLAVLMRLRLGLLLQDIADKFNVSASTMSRIFTTWLRLLSVELQQMFPWPTRDLVAQYTPQQFSKYPNTRVIIDCTELYIQRPSSLVSQSETFSNYKHHNTFKFW